MEPGSASLARQAVRQALGPHGLDRQKVEGAALAATELVTNAVRHDGPGPIVLRISVGNTVRIVVHDNDPAPPVIPEEPRDGGGRGLVLVSTLADDWGWTPEPGGKAVWFDLSTG